MHNFSNIDVERKFLSFPDDRRSYMLLLREMIYRVAKSDERIGNLSEQLRWGDPSYITDASKSGSTVRIGLFGASKVALFFHCKTNLVEGFRQKYSDELEYSKNRAIVMDPASTPDDGILESCIYESLTYKLRGA